MEDLGQGLDPMDEFTCQYCTCVYLCSPYILPDLAGPLRLEAPRRSRPFIGASLRWLVGLGGPASIHGDKSSRYRRWREMILG